MKTVSAVQSRTASLDDGHSYVGETHSPDCRCEVCGERCDRHADQQHYCEDCKHAHYGGTYFCVGDDE